MLPTMLTKAAAAIPLIAAEEERELLVRAQAGDAKARDHLVMSHLRLVMKAASKRRGSREDLVQEGTIGLLEAIDRFDLDQPFRFATYATWWVKNRLWLAVYLDQSIVRRPTSPTVKNIFNGLATLRAALERDPSKKPWDINRELARAFGVSTDIIESESARLGRGDKSLNAPLSEDSDLEVGDLLADDRPLQDSHLDDERILLALLRAMDALNPRERAVIAARKFIEDENEETLDELGRRLNLSKEGVRQIEQRALGKLRVELSRAGIGKEAVPA